MLDQQLLGLIQFRVESRFELFKKALLYKMYTQNSVVNQLTLNFLSFLFTDKNWTRSFVRRKE